MNRLSEADEMRATMRGMRIPEHAIERAIQQAQAKGLVERPAPPNAVEETARLEREVQAAGVKQLRALGFVAVNYSQPRATKQTPGVQDTEFFHPRRGVFLKWEVKTLTGEPSPDQVQYAEWCRACNVPYLCGTDQDLFAWLVERGIAARVEGGLLIALPYTHHEANP
jgi:hypothetical protein